MPKKKCPECNSDNVHIIKIGKKAHIVCNDCFYDETNEFDVYPEQRETQREKARYSPYKTGGSRRTASRTKK